MSAQATHSLSSSLKDQMAGAIALLSDDTCDDIIHILNDYSEGILRLHAEGQITLRQLAVVTLRLHSTISALANDDAPR